MVFIRKLILFLVLFFFCIFFRTIEAKLSDSDKAINKFSQNSPSSKKNTKSIFKRLSSPTIRSTEDESRPRLTSRVIRELPSRQEIVAAQSTDSASRARNRRMFGSLLGTLHKFCQEESRLKQKEEKKAQIEKKLEEQEILERESLKKERETLFIDRKRKQTEIRRLESKISRIKDYETWETSTLNLKNFIKTKTSPSIYYRPKLLSKKTEKLLTESSNEIDKTVKRKKNDLKLNLLKLEENSEFPEDETSDGTKCDFSKSSEPRETSRTKQNTFVSSICVINAKNCNNFN